MVCRSEVRLALLPLKTCRQLLEETPRHYGHLCRILAAKLGRNETTRQELEQVNQELLATLTSVHNHPDFEQVPGRSRWAPQVNEQIAQPGPGEAHVLVCEETGTGKELIARLLHHHRGRDGALFHLDCIEPPSC